MAKFSFRGMAEYEAMLERMGKNTRAFIGPAVYAMAGVVADEVTAKIRALPSVDDFQGVLAYCKKEKVQLTKSQKDGLLDGFGIAPMENDNGYWNVKLGFDGYNSTKTHKYPQGQPNAMIARSVESGSSVRNKTPFVRPAVRASEARAAEAGKAVIDEKLKDMTKGA